MLFLLRTIALIAFFFLGIGFVTASDDFDDFVGVGDEHDSFLETRENLRGGEDIRDSDIVGEMRENLRGGHDFVDSNGRYRLEGSPNLRGGETFRSLR